MGKEGKGQRGRAGERSDRVVRSLAAYTENLGEAILSVPR